LLEARVEMRRFVPCSHIDIRKLSAEVRRVGCPRGKGEPLTLRDDRGRRPREPGELPGKRLGLMLGHIDFIGWNDRMAYANIRS
jgi:hypothetical protein